MYNKILVFNQYILLEVQVHMGIKYMVKVLLQYSGRKDRFFNRCFWEVGYPFGKKIISENYLMPIIKFQMDF